MTTTTTTQGEAVEQRTPVLHTIPSEPNRYGDGINGLTEIRMYGKHQGHVARFALGFTTKGRREYKGPIIEGPWAYMYATPVVISATPYKQAPVVEAQEGDLVSFAGYVWRIEDTKPLHNPLLTLVAQVG